MGRAQSPLDTPLLECRDTGLRKQEGSRAVACMPAGCTIIASAADRLAKHLFLVITPDQRRR